ncbi:MAG: hypothetical protein ISR51_08290 [Rhodospirillales bacterium]|nr:hypothetical protein [Alphaproteobacteria bacterium]MBL6948662.1 hypothetical protein [Rhodospirillales bacterium]
MSDSGISDTDRDSLHILPMVILPLETPSLNRARLIKNVRLESVIELFTDKDTGSGQIGIEDLPQEFNWNMSDPPADMAILRKVGALPSYDVYSLRISLRDLEIPVNDHDALRLSDSMSKELTSYMTDFTRPLILQIYGGDDMKIESFEDVVKLFRDPDVGKALEKIRIMADKLNIKPEEIPRFMEDYGDIFLSLSYYRRCLDAIEPTITEFLEAMDSLRDNYQFKTDQNLRKTMEEMESTINGLMAAITGRFENFERGTKHMWDEISAERFRKVEQLISSYHTTIGGVLCSLSVKMDAWARLFPTPSAGGPGKRAEFIMSEMKQGMDKIQHIEDSAPMLSALN